MIDDKRSQILDAAVAEFQELGFAGASMDRIAARANVSKRTVYNHFDGKEALFRAILDIIGAEADAALELDYERSAPLEPQLLALGWTEGKLLTSAPFMRLARMAVGETMRDPALAAEMNARMEKISVFRRFMEDAQADGAIETDDPALAAEQFLGMIKAQAFWPVVFSGQVVSEDEMDKIIRSTADVFLKSYAAQTDPQRKRA